MSLQLQASLAGCCLLSLGLLAGVASAADSIAGCTFNDGAGHAWDFSSLAGGSYSATDSTGYLYQFNPCGVFTQDSSCALKTGTVCQYQAGPPVSFLAMIASWGGGTIGLNDPGDYTKGVKIHYANGDTCSGAPRTSDLIFTCSTQHVGTVSVASTPGGCNYEISFPTSLACASPAPPPGGGGGSDGGLSGGWIFIIILVCIIPVYIVVGCLINHRRTPEATWGEKCPQASFWKDLPYLVKDGCVFTVAKLRGCCSGSNSSTTGYSQEGV